jgi:hypothetical protein
MMSLMPPLPLDNPYPPKRREEKIRLMSHYYIAYDNPCEKQRVTTGVTDLHHLRGVSEDIRGHFLALLTSLRGSPSFLGSLESDKRRMV